MEIILKDLCCSSTNKEKVLTNVSWTFPSHKITFISGISGRLLRDLLIGKKKKLSGSIVVNPKGMVSDIGYLSNSPLKEFNSKNLYEEFNIIYKRFNLKFDITKRISDTLKMVNLSEDYLTKSFNTYSTTELKRAMLACVLFYNPKVIILDYFEKGFNYREIEYIKRILLKLKSKYEKNIIIVSDNLEEFMNIMDCFCIFNNGKIVVTGSNKDLYNEDIYKYIKCPKIIKFIKLAKDKNINLENYLDINELIKGIYRSVK